MRWPSAWVAVALVAGVGCASGALEQTTTSASVEEPSTTAVDTTSGTTPPEAPRPVDICSRGVVWDAGTTYTANCFLVPLTLEPVDGGWRSVGASDVWARFEWKGDAGDLEIGVAALAYQPDEEPQTVLDDIIAIEGVDAVAGSSSASVGGHPTLIIDVLTDPDPQVAAAGGNECSRPGSSLQWGYDAWPGYALVTDTIGGGPHELGLGACRTFRIWVLEAAGSTVTVLATVYDDQRFDELIPLVERLLGSATFGA